VSPPGALSLTAGKWRREVKFPRHQSHVARTQMHWHTPNAHCRLAVGQHERLLLCLWWTEFHTFFFQRRKDRSRQRRLKIWSLAQRESARRPMSDWGKLVESKFSSASKSRGPYSNALAYAERALST